MRHRHHRARPAFTLLELLVVMFIIAVLAALTASVVFHAMGGSATGSTRTTINEVETRVGRKMSAAADAARNVSVPARLLVMANNNPDRARIIFMKMRQKVYHPVSFAEVFDPSAGHAASDPALAAILKQVPAYVRHLTNHGITPPGNNPPGNHESAACLYMALRFGPDGASEEDVNVAGRVKTVNGLECIIDGWSSPVVFSRWPTGDSANGGMSIIHPSGSPGGFDDPLDPRGLLADASWLSTAGGQQFMAICHPVLPRAAGPRRMLAPAVVSIGPDRTPGFADIRTLAIGSGTDAAMDTVVSDRFR